MMMTASCTRVKKEYVFGRLNASLSRIDRHHTIFCFGYVRREPHCSQFIGRMVRLRQSPCR
jgi:hypothetical protein